MPELRLGRTFPAVYFVNTNPPEESVQVLLSKIELSKRPDDSPNFFNKSNIDWYIERPSAISAMENAVYFCYAENLAYYTFENISSKTCEYQSDELDNNLFENKKFSYPRPPKQQQKRNKVDDFRRNNVSSKKRRILLYHVPNELLSSEKLSDHVMLLYFPFRKKNCC